MHVESFSQRNLPEWFARPQPEHESQQRSLFEVRLDHLLIRLGVSEDECRRWHDRGWISFDPTPDMLVDETGGPHLNEIVFVRDVVRCGLSDAQVEYMFGMLPKPYNFNPSSISFSFRYGWVEVAPYPAAETLIEDNLDDWLSELADAGDVDRLQELRDRIEDWLKEARENSAEEVDDED